MQKGKLIGRIFGIALVLAMICLILPAGRTQAQDAYILLSPDEGIPGEEIRVYGYNFTPDRWIDIYYDTNGDEEFTEDEWVIDERADDYGYFQVDFDVPESYTGDHEILAEDTYGVDASDYFDVEPGLTIEPEKGPVGTAVTVAGHGFAENEENIELLYYLDGTTELVADNIEANQYGYWEAVFQVPSCTQGIHKLDAQGDASLLYEVQDAIFEVTLGIAIDKSSGSVGETITMVGSGFVPNETGITILFAGVAVVTDIMADDIGCWDATFVVPDMPAGTYNLTAEGEETPREQVGELSFEIEGEAAIADIEILKTANPTSVSEASIVVTYYYTVNNIGGITLTGVKVIDNRLGNITLGKTTLAPGEFTIGTASYNVTQADVDVGDNIVNFAIVTCDQEANDSDSAIVEIGTGLVLCFIATAAYGTTMADEVQILRDFRDEYLIANPLGQVFTNLYYRISPPIAEFITDHPSLKSIVRGGLMPAVAVSYVVVNATAAEKMVIVSLLVLVSVIVAVRATRRLYDASKYHWKGR